MGLVECEAEHFYLVQRVIFMHTQVKVLQDQYGPAHIALIKV